MRFNKLFVLKNSICLLLMIAFCVPCFLLNAYAQEAQTASEGQIFEALSEASDNADLENDFFAEGNAENAGNSLVDFLSPQNVLENLIGLSSDALGEALRLLCSLLGIVMLSAVFHALVEAHASSQLTRGAEYLSSAVIVAAVIGLGSNALGKTVDFFERLSALMLSMIPIGGTVLAMGGNVGSATVGTAGFYALVALTERLCADAVVPIVLTMSAAAVCSSLSAGGLLDGFCSAVKKTYNFSVAIIMAIFVFALGVQGSISVAADTLAARSGKLISTLFIPGVGGAVGDTLRTLAGSVGYIKSVVGVGGIVLLALLTLPVLLVLIFERLAFLICSSASQMLGCGKESKLLSEIGSIYGVLIGAVSICSIAFCIGTALFLRCTLAIA